MTYVYALLCICVTIFSSDSIIPPGFKFTELHTHSYSSRPFLCALVTPRPIFKEMWFVDCSSIVCLLCCMQARTRNGLVMETIVPQWASQEANRSHPHPPNPLEASPDSMRALNSTLWTKVRLAHMAINVWEPVVPWKVDLLGVEHICFL